MSRRDLDAADPADWLARLARADWLEEQGQLPASHATRGRGFLWAWARLWPAHRLCFVEGKGRRPLVAHFVPHDPALLTGDDWDEPQYVRHAEAPRPSLRLVFESPGHDVPADLGRQRRFAELSAARINAGDCPWLLPTAYSGARESRRGEPVTCEVADGAPPGVAVMAGAGVAEFCCAVESAGGWWLPLGDSGCSD